MAQKKEQPTDLVPLNVIRTETFYSHYARVNGLLLIGKKAAPAATPEPLPTPPPDAGGVVPPSPAP